MIQIRIAFVLRLVDDFTGACIKRKSFRFWTDEKILHPVQKEEGLYVFLEKNVESHRTINIVWWLSFVD